MEELASHPSNLRLPVYQKSHVPLDPADIDQVGCEETVSEIMTRSVLTAAEESRS